LVLNILRVICYVIIGIVLEAATVSESDKSLIKKLEKTLEKQTMESKQFYTNNGFPSKGWNTV